MADDDVSILTHLGFPPAPSLCACDADQHDGPASVAIRYVAVGQSHLVIHVGRPFYRRFVVKAYSIFPSVEFKLHGFLLFLSLLRLRAPPQSQAGPATASADRSRARA